MIEDQALTSTYDRYSASTSVDINQISDPSFDKASVNSPSEYKTTPTTATDAGKISSIVSLNARDSYLIDQAGSSGPSTTSHEGSDPTTATDAGEISSIVSLNARDSYLIDQAGSSGPSTTSHMPNEDSEMTASIAISPPLGNATKAQNIANGDVAMADGTGGNTVESLLTSNVDENLPDWLSSMVDYLREISTDKTWQDLITEFFLFEKSKPPSGV
jgi:hypothetical protein